MQFLVEDSTNANERAILVEGWNKLDPPTPIDISAVTLLVSINGDDTPDNADGTITRIGTTHLHRFVFDNDTQFQAFAAGDIGALIVPDSATGDGRMGLSFPFLVAAGNLGAAPQDVPTAEEVATAVNAEALDIIETYDRTSNTAATMGGRSLTIETDAAYLPIKKVT
jgi:hypothetical protein